MEGPARPQAAHWHDVDFCPPPPRFTVTLKAGEGVLALEGHLPGGRALGALCAEKPFLTSAIMELRVPQVRRLPVCISRVDTTHKCLSLFEALGRPRPLIFAHAICATHAHSPSARSIGFCVIWVCISSSSKAHSGNIKMNFNNAGL